MDEDLKIVLTSELEADEQASAQRIAAQLPNIAKLINSKSSIKVGIALDESSIKSQAQHITQQISQATKSQDVGVYLYLNRSSIDKIQSQLKDLGVNDNISRTMTEQLDKMGIQIDRISGRWERAKDGQERMLSLSIQGTDQLKRSVSYLQTYDAKNGDVATKLTSVTSNLEQQRKIQESIAEKARQDNESRISYLIRQKSLLADIQATYQGQTSANPIADKTHLAEVEKAYKDISKTIATMFDTEGKLDSTQRANLEFRIDSLQRLVKEYQNVEREEEKLSNKEQRDNESRIAFLNRQKSALSDIQAIYKGQTSASPITDEGNLKVVETTYEKIYNIIIEMISAEGELDVVQKSNIESLISGLRQTIKQYQLAEQTQKKASDEAKRDNESRIAYLTRQKSLLADIHATYQGQTSAKPVADETHLSELNAKYEAIEQSINDAASASGKFDDVQRANIEARIADLKRLVKEYQNAEYVATQLRTKDLPTVKNVQASKLGELEDRLKNSGTLTESFKRKIDELGASLQNVTSKDQLVAFLNGFDQLESEVSAFNERLRGAGKLYKDIMTVERQMTSARAELLKASPDKDRDRVTALQKELDILAAQRTELYRMLVPYGDITQYVRQASELDQSRSMNTARLNEVTGELADKARAYDLAMQSTPSTIADLEAKMRGLANPSLALRQNMEALRVAAAQYGNDQSAREKIETYERIQSLIASCRKEMTALIRIQNGDVGDFKFDEDLKKAKADLETIGRTWSALKHDKGLNQQFQTLQTNLAMVNNKMDLKRWTSQFAAFKSEVKAAGRNMLSIGDIIKSNAKKVLQWVTATSMLFYVMRLVRNALNTIVELDTAMVDLQKVTQNTREEYDRFYKSANETAKALGATTEEVIAQTAEWARLGYTLREAETLAKNSSVFASISPGMDISKATDGLVSIIKAYDNIDVEDTLDGIISKINEVGNNFAVSNADIVEVMTRTSSAMSAANNTFEETVALATAAIEITRDAASVGNGLKTLSMRIRGKSSNAPYVQKCA